MYANHVLYKVGFLADLDLAELTVKGLVADVDAHVVLEVVDSRENLAALFMLALKHLEPLKRLLVEHLVHRKQGRVQILKVEASALVEL